MFPNFSCHLSTHCWWKATVPLPRSGPRPGIAREPPPCVADTVGFGAITGLKHHLHFVDAVSAKKGSQHSTCTFGPSSGRASSSGQYSASSGICLKHIRHTSASPAASAAPAVLSRRTMLSRRMLPRRPARPAGDAPPGGGGCALSARNRVGIAADAADAARSLTSLLAISWTRPRPAHLAKVRVRDDAEMSAILKEGGCIERRLEVVVHGGPTAASVNSRLPGRPRGTRSLRRPSPNVGSSRRPPPTRRARARSSQR